jgi:hypothetical protein
VYELGEIASISVMMQTMELYSGFFDFSCLDCSTVYEHMSVLFNELMAKGVLHWGFTVYNATDGCGKQYWSAMTLFLLSLLATQFDLTFD